uniref:Uncharacterized protein n=1 Tax=Opuntia streptacantha TaxID=393608 RepID=A0A7C9EEW9_OPUST
MLSARPKQSSPANRTRVIRHRLYQLRSFNKLPSPTQHVNHARVMLCFRNNPKFLCHHIKIFLAFLNFPSVCTCGKHRDEGYISWSKINFKHPFKKIQCFMSQTMLSISINHGVHRDNIMLWHPIK